MLTAFASQGGLPHQRENLNHPLFLCSLQAFGLGRLGSFSLNLATHTF